MSLFRVFDDDFFGPVSRNSDWALADYNPRFVGNTIDRSFFNPKMDIYENEKEYKIYTELPGLKKEDIKLDIHNGALNIYGESKREESSDTNHLRYSSRTFGSFRRTVNLPSGLAVDKIDVKFESGILAVHIPKDEGSQRRTITIS